MRILAISDTHRKLRNLRRLSDELENIDRVLHMGDAEGDEDEIRSFFSCPVVFVRGNCDFSGAAPMSRIEAVEGYRIFMTHGHRFGIYYSHESLVEAARGAEADIVLYGHLHVPYIGEEKGIIVASPGSISEPRQENRKPTYMIIELEEGKEPKLTLYELEK